MRGCPTGFMPAAWATDIEPDYPSTDRQQLLLFAGDGASASINLGSHAFAWRLPGVIAGAITAALLYLLARILFRRRLVAGTRRALRAGRRDVLRPVADRHERRLRRPVHHRRLHALRGDLDGLVAGPGRVLGRHSHRSALLLGLALASKWVAAYAIGALLLLLLVRSALGRVLAILGLIGITARPRLHGHHGPRGPGLRQPDVPPDHGRADARRPSSSRSSTRSRGPTRSSGSPSARRSSLGTLALLRDARPRLAPDGHHGRPRVGHAAPRGDRPRAVVARRRRPVLVRRPDRVRAARRATGPSTTRPPARPPGGPPDGWLRPGWLARAARRLGRGLPRRASRSSSTSSRTSRGR